MEDIAANDLRKEFWQCLKSGFLMIDIEIHINEVSQKWD